MICPYAEFLPGGNCFCGLTGMECDGPSCILAGELGEGLIGVVFESAPPIKEPL